jgi:hypothetical protein
MIDLALDGSGIAAGQHLVDVHLVLHCGPVENKMCLGLHLLVPEQTRAQTQRRVLRSEAARPPGVGSFVMLAL